MKLQIFQVDAFTSEPFGGNPAAVVPLDAWLPPETMQAIALETAFFVPGGDGQYEIRWFTPTFEIDLCGHATLASAFTIFEVLKLESNIVNFHSHKSGKLSVEKNGDVLTLDFPSRPVSPAEAPDGLIEAIGKMPKEVFKARDYFLVYENEQIFPRFWNCQSVLRSRLTALSSPLREIPQILYRDFLHLRSVFSKIR